MSVIGFMRTYQLGYVDSGFHEDPADVEEGTFSRVPLDEPSRALAAIIRKERPHVVVTYPESGGYPHPDHIMNHLVTVRGMELAEDPDADLGGQPGAQRPPWRTPKVYATSTFPLERLEALHAAMLETYGESPYTEWLESRADRAASDVPDTRVWCAEQFGRRDAALLAHVSQIDPEGFWFGIPRDLEAEHYPYEAYVLLRTDVLTQVPEEDLFAGLDVEAIDADAAEDPRASRGA